MFLFDIIEPQVSQLNRAVHVERADPTFLPIHLTGGVGDVIMSLDAIRKLQLSYQVVVYTFHIEAFKYFYKYPISVFKDLPDYHWKLEFNTITKFHFQDSFHGFAVKAHEDLFLKQRSLFRDQPKLEMLVKTHYNKFFLLAHYAKQMGWDRLDFPMRCLGNNEILGFETTPLREREKYFTIHDGYDIHNASIVSGRATKTWKWEYWNQLVRDLKAKYPEYKIVQLGHKATARLIDGVDEQLVGKTTIVEAFDILAKSALHIDGDSGLVHAATRMQVPTVVLWGPTPEHFYGYPQNVNLRNAKSCAGSCYGVKENWNDRCPIGFSTCQAMDDISPEEVMEAVGKVL